jgi:hypothetical protein
MSAALFYLQTKDFTMKRYSIALTKDLLSKQETITQNLTGLGETDGAQVALATQ